MKKRSLILVFSLIFLTTNASAGWLTKALKGGALIGVGVMIGGASAPSSAQAKRLKSMNHYVWDALEWHDLTKPSLEHYIAELEVSNIIHMTDTAAFGYALLGQKSKAISVYKDKIVPYIPLVEDTAAQADYERAYEIIQECEPRTCMRLLNPEKYLYSHKSPTEAKKFDLFSKAVSNGVKKGKPNTWQTLDKLAYSGKVSIADTGAYGYAVISDREKALEIYEEEILPRLDSLSNEEQQKYLAAYEFLKTCDLQYCLRDRPEQL